MIVPIPSEESEEATLAPERVEARLQKFFPKPGRYPIEYVNVYGVSQRVASTFRRGRVLLAGDSAHVNNPIGGMGMNGGIHDAVNLADKLARVWHGEADETSLDLYSRQRRHAAVEYVQAQTIANKKMMEERDPQARAASLDELRRTAEDPRGGPALHAPRRAARQPQFRECGEVSEAARFIRHWESDASWPHRRSGRPAKALRAPRQARNALCSAVPLRTGSRSRRGGCWR